MRFGLTPEQYKAKRCSFSRSTIKHIEDLEDELRLCESRVVTAELYILKIKDRIKVNKKGNTDKVKRDKQLLKVARKELKGLEKEVILAKKEIEKYYK